MVGDVKVYGVNCALAVCRPMVHFVGVRVVAARKYQAETQTKQYVKAFVHVGQTLVDVQKKLLADLVQDVIFWGAAPAFRNAYSQT